MSTTFRNLTLSALAAMIVASPAAAADDRLVAAPYPSTAAWKKVVDHEGPGGSHGLLYLPADQTPATQRDSLLQASTPLAAEITPAQFLVHYAKSKQKECLGMRANGPFEKTEAGVQVAYLQVYCGRVAGTDYGRHHFLKALRGASRIHFVDREFRVAPSEVGGVTAFPADKADEAKAFMAAQAQANSYLSASVYLCGGTSTDPRCGS